jgi:LCP family protein required for cell wall assembly
MSRRGMLLRLLLLLIVALAIGLGVYHLGREWEGASAPETVRGTLTIGGNSAARIVHNGQTYRPQTGLVTVLFMGIDHEEGQEITGFRNGGQADFLVLMVINPRTKTLSRIQIDRDTMTEITVLGVLGNVAGMRRSQISLSHGFGNGGAQSNRFTLEAVSRLLLGAKIDFYVALNLASIGRLNEAVGGVTVTIEDDFSAQDARMVPGATLTLDAQQAELFVRGRMAVGDGTNTARMRRQQVYMTAVLEAVKEKIMDDPNYIITLFDALAGAMDTDMSRARMLNEANRVSDYTIEAIQTLAGSHGVGEDGFTEFHADEAQLQELVIGLLYEPVEE